MTLLLQASVILSVQVLLGSLLSSLQEARRARGLPVVPQRPLRLALSIIGAGSLLTLAFGWSGYGQPFSGWGQGLQLSYAFLGAQTASGCCRVLRAGRHEHRGERGAARDLSRDGGFEMVFGTLLIFGMLGLWIAAVVPSEWATRLVDDRATAGATLVFLASGAGAAFVGLLAGLSGKPRPSGYFALGLLLTSVLSGTCAMDRLQRLIGSISPH